VTSLQCPVQMFRVGRNVYATQFHPEGDPEGFILRVRTYRGHGYFLPEEAADLIDTLENEHAPVPRRVLARFVERYRK
ncbi:MAG: glutamine amidotransferase, partial [Gemmatimonadetes bacterium]|nr:glutamine amidotransferase [Gemmatimonadota bacterium]